MEIIKTLIMFLIVGVLILIGVYLMSEVVNFIRSLPIVIILGLVVLFICWQLDINDNINNTKSNKE
jgi:putative effector of murein hydrolase LrgA (UPF0299 family)